MSLNILSTFVLKFDVILLMLACFVFMFSSSSICHRFYLLKVYAMRHLCAAGEDLSDLFRYVGDMAFN